MHISITDDWKKRFRAACALRGLKMSQVVVDMIEQWLKANAIQLSNGVLNNSISNGKLLLFSFHA